MIPICHVQVFPILAGAQRSMLSMLDQLDRDEYRPYVICQGPGPLVEQLRRRDIPTLFAPELDRPMRLKRDWKAYSQLHELFRSYQFRLVHTHSSKPGILARIAARRAGIETIVHHVHAFAFHEHSSWPKRQAYSRLERFAGRYCDHVIFVNEEERSMADRHKLISRNKSQTIYNGVNLAALHPDHRTTARHDFCQQHQLSETDTLILFLGRLAYPKQSTMPADIAAKLTTRLPHANWKIVIAGSGPDEKLLAERASQLGVSDRIKHIGWLAEPESAILSADIMLQTSLAEGLPMALIEAHAAGIPCVASDAKGNREVVVHDVTGMLCPFDQPVEYAEQLARLITESHLRESMGSAARCRAEKIFDERATGRQVLQLYDWLLGRQKTKQILRRAA